MTAVPPDAGTDRLLHTFAVGCRVEKHGGAYQLTGTIVAAFHTLAGEERYVVEHAPAAPGLLHIYGPQNLRLLEEETGG